MSNNVKPKQLHFDNQIREKLKLICKEEHQRLNPPYDSIRHHVLIDMMTLTSDGSVKILIINC